MYDKNAPPRNVKNGLLKLLKRFTRVGYRWEHAHYHVYRSKFERVWNLSNFWWNFQNAGRTLELIVMVWRRHNTVTLYQHVPPFTI